VLKYIAMKKLLLSESINPEIDGLLLSGRAATASEAENMFLDAHLDDLTRLIVELSDEEFKNHEAIKLLMFHGSRQLEDALT
jgi:hypothetical protein